MKKILVVAMLFLAFNTAKAQTKVIKANPLGLIFGIANAGYEFSTNEKQTATISGLYFNVSDITGAGIGFEYRFYFKGEAIKGWHAGPAIGYFSLQDNFNTSASILSFGGEIGHQWVLNGGFAIDVFAGLSSVSGGDDLDGFNSAGGSFGVALGYAW